MVDNVNHPVHYTSSAAKCACGRTIECIQVTEHMNFCLGSATKYLWRVDLKGGVEDLKKAVWYIQREIARRESTKQVDSPLRPRPAGVHPLDWPDYIADAFHGPHDSLAT